MRAAGTCASALTLILLCGPGRAQQAELGPAPIAPDQRKLLESQRRLAAAPLAIGSWFDVSNRDVVRYFYQTLLVPTDSVAMGWTGSIAGCVAGTTSEQYRNAVRQRINWFRAMAGVPAAIALDPIFNSKDQDAALMMSANRALNHNPPANWSCYTAAGAEAASRSNLCSWYGTFDDPGCVALYMQDTGASNTAVGHRRWLLYPQTETMGTGDVFQTGSGAGAYPTANALWVIPSSWPPRPATREEFVAWPPQGYVPYKVVPARWSFSYPAADFSSATVSMTRFGAPVPVRLETPAQGYGENSLVWVPDNLDTNVSSPWPRPLADTPITVTVSNVLIGAQSRNFTYVVTIFDPESPALGPITPVAAFRDAWGSVRAVNYASSVLYNGGGIFASDPAAALNFSANLVAVARDTYNSLWANIFSPSSGTWGSWAFGAGVTKGTPAIAVATNGTAYIAARDNWNSYWLTSYTPAGGFGPWFYLAGIFSTDPAMCAAPDGSVYIIGKDNWNSLWSGRYVPGSGFQNWVWGQGIVKGKPAVACGTDGAAYVAVRDNWDSLWMARVSGNTWTGWHYGGGIMSADPQAASAGAGVIYTVVRDTWGGIWYRGFTEGTGPNWQSWVFTGGILQDFSPAGVGGELYIAGRDASNGLWWYRTTSGWTWSGNVGAAGGPLAAAPR